MPRSSTLFQYCLLSVMSLASMLFQCCMLSVMLLASTLFQCCLLSVMLLDSTLFPCCLLTVILFAQTKGCWSCTHANVRTPSSARTTQVAPYNGRYCQQMFRAFQMAVAWLHPARSTQTGACISTPQLQSKHSADHLQNCYPIISSN